MNRNRAGSVFDVDRIRQLVELMKEHDLSEVDLRESRQRIRICRGPKEPPSAGVCRRPPPPPPRPPAPAPAAAPAAKAAGGRRPRTSPSSRARWSARSTSPAESRRPSLTSRSATASIRRTVVCIIEAMKVFNEIPAEVRGKIVAVLCENGEAVEFDKPLFKVDTQRLS